MQEFWSLFINFNFWQVLDKILPLLTLIVAICAIYITLIVAIFAIYVANRSRREARVAAQVNIFYQLMARYSSPEMQEAVEIIRELFDVRRQNEAAFHKVVKRYRNKDFSVSALMPVVKAGTPSELFRHTYDETNQARLRVSSFFKLSFDLFTDSEVLDAFYFKKICSIKTFKFLYHVIEWLESAFNPDYDIKTFTKLLEQSGREDIEDLRKLRPPETGTK